MSDHSIYCAAHSCPMLGFVSRSTTGGNEWFCSIHFGAPAKRWGEITDELNRLGWLVKITQNLRATTRDNVLDVINAANKTCALNQSNYLKLGENETPGQWLIRLETVLADSCKPRQHDLDSDE